MPKVTGQAKERRLLALSSQRLYNCLREGKNQEISRCFPPNQGVHWTENQFMGNPENGFRPNKQSLARRSGTCPNKRRHWYVSQRSRPEWPEVSRHLGLCHRPALVTEPRPDPEQHILQRTPPLTHPTARGIPRTG